MSEIRRVNRPVFRLSKPGQDVKWTTRKGQVDAIKKRRMELAQPTPLPTELPEKQDFPSEDPQTGAELSRDTEAGLEYLNDDELQSYADEAITDGQLEALDEEFERRGWISREPTPEDIVKREYLRKRLSE